MCSPSLGTLGVSLSPCSVPGCLPSFDLPPGDMELGLGEREEEGSERWMDGLIYLNIVASQVYRSKNCVKLLNNA